MRLVPIALVGALSLSPAALAQMPADLHVAYATYAAGLEVAASRVDLRLSPYQYRIRLAYHSTGLVGFFDHGETVDLVDGIWRANRPWPQAFSGTGVWHGKKLETQIDYRDGDPLVKTLLPPDQGRQPVPAALKARSIDTLSAVAMLMRQVAQTRQCQASVRTYDGRRVAELTAHTVGWERLPHIGRSTYSGPALRCDFTSRVLAGFPVGDHKDRPPLHGTVWFAAAIPGEPPLPVRVQFDTAWFGEATTYLTEAKAEAPEVAQQR